MLAAYALVFQAFLAYSMATQAIAQGASPYSGSFFVICETHDSGTAPDDAGAPVKAVTHCPICTLSTASATTLPDPVLLPMRQSGVAKRTTFVTIAACVAFHNARAGLSRAPPQTV